MSAEETQTSASAPTQQKVEITEKITSPSPAKIKNPNRVAAGKRTAERTKMNRERQKKNLEEALEKNKKFEELEKENTPPSSASEDKKGFFDDLSLNHIIAIGSFLVSAVGFLSQSETILSFFKPSPPKTSSPPIPNSSPNKPSPSTSPPNTTPSSPTVKKKFNAV